MKTSRVPLVMHAKLGRMTWPATLLAVVQHAQATAGAGATLRVIATPVGRDISVKMKPIWAWICIAMTLDLQRVVRGRLAADMEDAVATVNVNVTTSGMVYFAIGVLQASMETSVN